MAIRKTIDGTVITKDLGVVIHGYVQKVDTTASPRAPIPIRLQIVQGETNMKNLPIVFVEPNCLKAATDLPFTP
jgi:hypothetical protein